MSNSQKPIDAGWKFYNLIYHAVDDPRLWVPKKYHPNWYSYGWTINFGHPYGYVTMVGVIGGSIILSVYLEKLIPTDMSNSEIPLDSGWKFYDLIYHSPDDPRLWVPKKYHPNWYSYGWTINFGHPYGYVTMVGVLGGSIIASSYIEKLISKMIKL
jgi:uncharacterized membrane protein